MRLQENNMKKKNIAAISITLLIILITAGCGSNKNSGTESAATEESVVEEAEVEEFYHLDANDTFFSINEKGEKVGEFHEEKIKEILGLDDKGDFVNIITCSDKIAICICYNSEVEEYGYGYGLYAVNETLGKSIELEKVPHSYDNVDYYKGDFYFTYDDKELICSIEDSLEYVVKEADLGSIADKLENEIICIPYRHMNGSITRLLDEVGYVIVRDFSGDGYAVMQKDGTVTELPQRGCKHYVLMCYDKNVVFFQKYFDSYYKSIPIGYYYIKLDTMEENKLPYEFSEESFYTVKNGKLYWSILSEQDKSADILYKKIYYASDVESDTASVLAQTDVTPGLEYDITFHGDNGLCICGDNIFIKAASEDKVKWFRIDKAGDNISLADMDLTIKTIQR